MDDNRAKRFRLNPDRKVKVLDYFNFPVIVIDDLYADAEAVRETALGLDYERRRFSYPGAEALLYIPGHELCPMLDGLISSVVNRSVVVEPSTGILGGVPDAAPHHQFKAVRPPPEPFMFSPANINPRDLVTFTALEANTQIKSQPHYDGGDGMALIVYLNPDDQCRGGTALYRHLHSDLVARPSNPSPEFWEKMRAKGYADEAALARAITYVGASNSGTEDWEPEWKLERVIAMRWNRLVCYPQRLLHSLFVKPGDFGNTLDTTRLTMNLFLMFFEYNEDGSIAGTPGI